MLEDRPVSRFTLPPPAVPLSSAVSSASASDPELPVLIEALPELVPSMPAVSSVDGLPLVAAQELGVSSASAAGSVPWRPLQRLEVYRAAADSGESWWFDPQTGQCAYMIEGLAACEWSGHSFESCCCGVSCTFAAIGNFLR